MDALLLGILLQGVGGTLALLLSRYPRAATAAGVGGAVAGCLLCLPPALGVLLGEAAPALKRAWDSSHGVFAVELDVLSAFFLLPVAGLSALAAIYGGNYLLSYRATRSLGPPWLFFNLFLGGMEMVLIARTALLFLVAWEVMSVAAFALVTFEHEKAEVRKAGWTYLVATHLGVLFLFLAFLLRGQHAGGLEFQAFRALPVPGPVRGGVLFVLALIGFGAKAGLVPYHVWLPEAHPAAPSHVSALMSGVMIKMGIYGILRFITFLGPPAPWWGLTLAGVGLLTALMGIALALAQRDIKRALAYSSIENIGLIAVGLGVGLWGKASGSPAVAVLGTAAALLHVWNHALMKGLMFLAAGSVLHGTGTRDLEHLGGLMKRMPWTGLAFMVGAVAMAALPPLNGFVGKWLLYLSLLNAGLAATPGGSLIAMLAAGLLALIGGLAAITYVRLAGIVLLGSPRSEAAEHAHESSPWLVGPMLILGLLCLSVAVDPQTATGALGGVLDPILGLDSSQTFLELGATQAPLWIIGNVNAWILAATLVGSGVLLALTRKAMRTEGPTWGCGYLQPTARIQYTGRSFAEMLAEHLLPRLLRPRTSLQAPHGLFPVKAVFSSACPEPLSEKFYEPFFRRWAESFSWLRILQHGKLHVYLAYIMLMVVLGLAWASLRTWWWGTS